jgi:hypothetical protein
MNKQDWLTVGSIMGVVVLVIGAVVLLASAPLAQSLSPGGTPPTPPPTVQPAPMPACPYGCTDFTGHASCAKCRGTICPKVKHVCVMDPHPCPYCGADDSGHPACRCCGFEKCCPYQKAPCGVGGLCQRCLDNHMSNIPHDVCPAHGYTCGYYTQELWWKYWQCGVPGCQYYKQVKR